MNTLTNKVSDKEIEIAFKLLGCDVDVSGEYGEPDRFAITSDSLQSFIDASNEWLRCGSRKKIDNAAIFTNVSTKIGEQRFDLYVMDFGDVRITCKY